MRSITIQEATKVFASLLLTAAFGVVQAHAKPDINGTWKVNVSKSDFGPMPAPDSQTSKVSFTDPDLKVAVASSGQMGDLNYDLHYTTDGKESTNTVMGNEMKSTAKWEGDELVIDTTGNFNGTDFTAKDRWSLSEDGKTLTVLRHLNFAGGDGDQKIIMEKQ